MTKVKAIPPQKGKVTNHHDQLITLHNFSIINAIPSNPKVVGTLPFCLLSILFKYFNFNIIFINSQTIFRVYKQINLMFESLIHNVSYFV